MGDCVRNPRATLFVHVLVCVHVQVHPVLPHSPFGHSIFVLFLRLLLACSRSPGAETSGNRRDLSALDFHKLYVILF